MRIKQFPAMFLIAIARTLVILTRLSCGAAIARKRESQAPAGSATARRSKSRRVQFGIDAVEYIVIRSAVRSADLRVQPAGRAGSRPAAPRPPARPVQRPAPRDRSPAPHTAFRPA